MVKHHSLMGCMLVYNHQLPCPLAENVGVRELAEYLEVGETRDRQEIARVCGAALGTQVIG